MFNRLKNITILSKIKPSNKPIPPIPHAVWTNPIYFFAFGFGSGTVPFAPGTFGTLAAIPFYLLLRHLSVPLYIGFVIFFIAISSWACEQVSKDIHEHDHPGMCIDEFAGFFVTMIAAPFHWQWIVLGFLLFRLFDIWKPWPINYLDATLHGGFGMVFDDVVAGVYALLIIQLFVYL